jgi:deoxycytidylate deaminase
MSKESISNSTKNFVIGLTGSLGSGCTTLSRVLDNKGFKRISISESIKEKFRELYPGKEPTIVSFGEEWRSELQDIGNRGRKGEFVKKNNIETNNDNHCDYWLNLALEKIGSHRGDVVIDGIRNIGEVESLRRKYPQSHFWLVAVYADYETRWKRVQDISLYQNELIFKRDDIRDSDEDDRDGQSVQKCVYEADYVFKNEKHYLPKSKIIEELTEKLIGDISVMKGEKRTPTTYEVSMATAVSQSHASRCIKRKVGALIIDETKKIPLSVGYNDNPIGMEPCFTLHKGCYKDMIMEAKLEDMGPLFCPECGKKHEKLVQPWKCDGEKSDGTHCRCNFKLRFFPSRNIELCSAIHAEERAIRSLGGRNADGCTLFINTFPCFQCIRYIKDADIKKVVYIEAYPIKEAVDFLKKNDIIIEPFEGFKPRVFNQVFKQVE